MNRSWRAVRRSTPLVVTPFRAARLRCRRQASSARAGSEGQRRLRVLLPDAVPVPVANAVGERGVQTNQLLGGERRRGTRSRGVGEDLADGLTQTVRFGTFPHAQRLPGVAPEAGGTNDEIAVRLGCVMRTVARRLDLIRKIWLEKVP